MEAWEAFEGDCAAWPVRAGGGAAVGRMRLLSGCCAARCLAPGWPCSSAISFLRQVPAVEIGGTRLLLATVDDSSLPCLRPP